MPRDIRGNELRVGDFCCFEPDFKNQLKLCKITAVSDGGVAIDRHSKTPASVTLYMEITLTNAMMPFFPMLCKTVNPEAEKTISDAMDSDTGNGPKLVKN